MSLGKADILLSMNNAIGFSIDKVHIILSFDKPDGFVSLGKTRILESLGKARVIATNDISGILAKLELLCLLVGI